MNKSTTLLQILATSLASDRPAIVKPKGIVLNRLRFYARMNLTDIVMLSHLLAKDAMCSTTTKTLSA